MNKMRPLVAAISTTYLKNNNEKKYTASDINFEPCDNQSAAAQLSNKIH